MVWVVYKRQNSTKVGTIWTNHMHKAISILSFFVRCCDTNNNTFSKSGKYGFPIADPLKEIMLMNTIDMTDLLRDKGSPLLLSFATNGQSLFLASLR